MGGSKISRFEGILDTDLNGEFTTVRYSVNEIKRILASTDEPDPEFLSALSRDPRKSVRSIAHSYFRRKGSLVANEEIFKRGSVRLLAGADEAGRGAIAGPLAAAAVVLKPDVVIDDIADSKALTPEKREDLYEKIIQSALCVSVCFIDPALIDRWGIQLMNRKALKDVVEAVSDQCHCVICDHLSLSGIRVPSYSIAHADSTFQCVAAASVVAKVERDRVMSGLHKLIPHYNFHKNKGYATEEHMNALSVYGPCEIHRMSFHGVSPGKLESGIWEE